VEAHPREIFFFEPGHVSEWLDELEEANQDAYDAIVSRLERVEEGNFGDYGPAGEVLELRFIRTGPGYRIYFGRDGDLVIILHAGIKKSQDADIKIANKLWRQYKDG
jgi:putative addiction module killer protein